MSQKLIVQVRRLREEGWALPRHRHAFRQPHEGIFSLQEELVPALHRHARVAKLIDPQTGKPVAGVVPLYDAALLRATADEWVVAGIERLEQGMRFIDVAQTWLITLARLESVPTWAPGDAFEG